MTNRNERDPLRADADLAACEHAADERRRARQAAEYWANAGVPKKFRDVPMELDANAIPEFIDVGLSDEAGERVRVRAPYRRVHEELMKLESKTSGAIIAMIGDRGAGKTYMACNLVKRFCRAGRRAKYAELLDLYQDLRMTIGPKAASTEADIERDYLRPALLVLDAVEEKSGEKEFQGQTLTRLVNKRLQEDRLTLLISNDTAESLRDRIGRSLSDRLNDGGGIIVCDWPSLRGRA